ncbi:hypothetical protein J7I92_14505 [Arthrobacter sp. ISL-72]|nr:hypothetical protein [Arthrobacter sp. ISL-72]MBT2596435.1 hypothetical protein [Arthrobacter sp. ISL-72]
MRKLLSLLIAIPLLVFAAGPAGAAAAKGSFEYHVGDALIQDFGGPVGKQAIAQNGDIVTIVATGTFDTIKRTATGGGTFAHHVAATGQTITGTFTTTGLVSFQSYGDATPQGLPASFFGGKLMLSIVATPDAAPNVHLPATLTVECALGKVPAGAEEGIRLNVKDVINFNKTVRREHLHPPVGLHKEALDKRARQPAAHLLPAADQRKAHPSAGARTPHGPLTRSRWTRAWPIRNTVRRFRTRPHPL